MAQIQLCLTQTSGEVTNYLAVMAWFQKVQTEKVWGVCEHVCLSRWIFPLISWHGGNNPAPSVFTQPLREITVLPPAQGFLKKSAASLTEGRFWVSFSPWVITPTSSRHSNTSDTLRRENKAALCRRSLKKKESSQFTVKQLEAFEITVKCSCLDMPLRLFLALHNEGRHCDKTSLFAHHSPDTAI